MHHASVHHATQKQNTTTKTTGCFYKNVEHPISTVFAPPAFGLALAWVKCEVVKEIELVLVLAFHLPKPPTCADEAKKNSSGFVRNTTSFVPVGAGKSRESPHQTMRQREKLTILLQVFAVGFRFSVFLPVYRIDSVENSGFILRQKA